MLDKRLITKHFKTQYEVNDKAFRVIPIREVVSKKLIFGMVEPITDTRLNKD